MTSNIKKKFNSLFQMFSNSDLFSQSAPLIKLKTIFEKKINFIFYGFVFLISTQVMFDIMFQG